MTLKSTKFKITALALCAIMLLTGIGFSAWVFTNPVQTPDANVTSRITCAVELNNNFKLYKYVDGENDVELTNLYLICDAPASGLNALAGNGVYWSTTNDSTAYANRIEGSVLYIKGTLNYNAYDIADASTVTVTFAAGTNYSLNNGTYIEFGAANIPAPVVVSVANNAEVKSAQFALPTVSYNSGVNTTNFNSVASVANITAGLSTLKLAFQATITAKA